MTVGAPRVILQSLCSILLCFQHFEGLYLTSTCPLLYIVSPFVLFFCLHFLFPPCSVRCKIIFASALDLVMCPYYLNMSFLTTLKMSSLGSGRNSYFIWKLNNTTLDCILLPCRPVREN